jgi:hypothetical protein
VKAAVIAEAFLFKFSVLQYTGTFAAAADITKQKVATMKKPSENMLIRHTTIKTITSK